jgi:hypothetical protein
VSLLSWNHHRHAESVTCGIDIIWTNRSILFSSPEKNLVPGASSRTSGLTLVLDDASRTGLAGVVTESACVDGKQDDASSTAKER